MLLLFIFLMSILFTRATPPADAPPRSNRNIARLAQSDPRVDLAAVERMAVSANSRGIAWTSSDAHAASLAVVVEQTAGKKQTLTFGASDFDEFLAGGAVVDLAWSADGTQLAVELSTGEEDGTILLLEPARSSKLRVVSVEGDASFALPRWSTAGHVLYFVSAGTDRPAAGGIIRLDLDANTHRRLVKDLWVTDFTVRERELTALVTDLEVTGPAHLDRFIRVDLRTGKSETVISRTTVEEDEKTHGLEL